MTLVLGSNIGNEAYWGTDTLVHYPDGKLEHKRKYSIFKDISLAIFPRGSDILTSIWIDNFRRNLGAQTIPKFFEQGYEQPLRALVPTYQDYLLLPNHKPCSEAEYMAAVNVELVHCFYDPNAGVRCILLVNYDAGSDVRKVEFTRRGWFSRPYEDGRLKVYSFEPTYIGNILIPVAISIKKADDQADQKAIIGGELEVIHFSGPNIAELGSQYSFS